MSSAKRVSAKPASSAKASQEQQQRSAPRALLSFVLYALLFLSGLAALGYEIVWTRMFALGLGHEIASMLAVVAAFFGGLAAGAWAFDRRVSRSDSPGLWYGVFEATIGVWALVSIALVPWANQLAASLTGPAPSPLHHWCVAFFVPFVFLLPATMAMGATLPAMDRLFCRLRGDGRSIGGLYAANTFGAVVGVAAATFILVPQLGYQMTMMALAVVNLLCAAAVVLRFGHRLSIDEEDDNETEENEADDLPTWRLTAALFGTGLLGIGYEVLGIRVLSQVLENTVYTFAAVLAVFLLGTATGAAIYQAFGKRCSFQRLLTILLIALSAACLGGVFVLSAARSLHEGLSEWCGAGTSGTIAAEAILALLVFGLPTLIMGAIFSHLAQTARRPGGGVGRAIAINTLGGAIAPPLFVVWLLPMWEAKWALVAVALGYLALLGITMAFRRGWEWALLAVPAVLLVALPADLNLLQPLEGGEILTYREGVMAAVAVVTDTNDHRHLKVNDRFLMGTTATEFGERRQAHLPLLLHPDPKSALFLGLGTGITAAAATDHPELKSSAVELVPEVMDVLPLFESATGKITEHDRLTLHVADARRFVAATPDRYDVIVADLFHPARDGAGALYTKEHFSAVRSRLNENGIFCQWVPLYQMDLETLRVIVGTFLKVFPDARAYLLQFSAETPAIGLIGTAGKFQYGRPWIRRRVKSDALLTAIRRIGFADDFALFGSLLALPEQLQEFAAGRPLNTDDRPIVNFEAPQYTYSGPRPAHEALIELVDTFEAKADPLTGSPSFQRRLRDYLVARNLYLRAEARRVAGIDDEAMNGYVLSAKVSSDFRVGYTVALAIAAEHARNGDKTAAERILGRLIEANPLRTDARDLRNLIRKKP